MLDFEKLGKIAGKCGFTHWGELDVGTLEFKQEVRDMCEKNTWESGTLRGHVPRRAVHWSRCSRECRDSKKEFLFRR